MTPRGNYKPPSSHFLTYSARSSSPLGTMLQTVPKFVLRAWYGSWKVGGAPGPQPIVA